MVWALECSLLTYIDEHRSEGWTLPPPDEQSNDVAGWDPLEQQSLTSLEMCPIREQVVKDEYCRLERDGQASLVEFE